MLADIAFLHAILEEPSSAVDRLVYADWLDEQRDDRGQLLRIQGELLRCPRDRCEYEALARQEHALLGHRRNRRPWVRLRKSLRDWPDACRAIDECILTPLSVDPDGFQCPVCSGTKVWRWDRWNPLMLHWVLNPGLGFNELVLGQRLPALIYTCRTCPDGRQFTRCADCRQLLPLDLPELNRGFGYWLGMHCPECGGQVPMLTNIVTGAVTLAGKALTGYGWLWGKKS